MKITLFLSSLWLALAALFSPAEKTILTGKVTDPSGEALIGANVKVLKNNEIVWRTMTDYDGNYRLELDSGTYHVEFLYTGFATRRILDVKVRYAQINLLDATLEPNADLQEVVVTAYKVPLIEQDKMSYGHTLSSDEIKTLPTRPTTGKAEEKSSPKKKAVEKKEAAKPSSPKPEAAPYVAEEVRVTSPPASDFDNPMKLAYKPTETEISREEAIEIADKEVVVPPPGGPSQPALRAGLLTAGEWNDLHNWNNHWLDLLADGEIEAYQAMYGFFPKQRYTVLLTNEQDFPLADVPVMLLNRWGQVLWEAKTDNTGKAELWVEMFGKESAQSFPVITFWVNGKPFNPATPLKPAKDGINHFKTEAKCEAPKNVDIVWAVDATGSMGDEIEYLKTELLDVIGRAKSRNPELAFRMGTVFYRDVTDAYITKSSGLSPDISKTVDFIKKQSADGGGDYPEAVHSALEEAIFNQKWGENAIARICFLVLDASPHQSPEVNASLQKSIREAARLGIRIVPVTASGIQKDTEFLMKFFGLATNGSYVFLTDHSGIGGKHLEPTSDEYKVEPLNDLLVRIITEYTTVETCEGKSEIRFADDPQGQNANWQAFYYPNPASTQFTLELPSGIQSVTIYNSEGKSVRKLEKPQEGRHDVLVSDLPAGFYTIRVLKDGQLQSGKLIVVRV